MDAPFQFLTTRKWKVKKDISKSVESKSVIYQVDDGHTKIDVRFEDETQC